MQYYKRFELRTPYIPVKYNLTRDLIFDIVGIVFIFIGLDYLIWRWNYSINWDIPVISLPLFIAEVLSFTGSILTVINYWSHKDIKKKKPVRFLGDIKELGEDEEDRPLKIDVFIASYNEELEIVEDTIIDATKLKYPYDDVELNIYLLDDGRRDGRDPEKENFKKLAEKYGIGYFVREDNVGFKAGNMNNAYVQTDGDLIVILDADTRVFPNFLKNTTGYFRNKKMGWIQTPQWFYDIPQGIPLRKCLAKKIPFAGKYIGKLIPFSKNLTVGKNIFGTDPRLFYDIILRRRNAGNAGFSCGAGSIQRREALDKLGEKEKQERIKKKLKKAAKDKSIDLIAYEKELQKTEPFRPFAHHISEDIFTSILLHNEGWESYQHPDVECKMLSPQTLDDTVKQSKRYAEGTLDIAFSKHNPLFKKGLSWRQKAAYFETIWSYLSPFWLAIFMLYPTYFFFTLQAPLKAFNFDFFLRIVPFLLLNVAVATLGNWGVSTKRSEQYYMAGIWGKFIALLNVVFGKKIKFNVTKKSVSKTGNKSLKHIWPHLTWMTLTLIGFSYNLYLVCIHKHPSYSALFANTYWMIFNFYQITPFIRAGFWKNDYDDETANC